MSFLQSIGFWLAKALTEFLIGLTVLVLFIAFFAWATRDTGGKDANKRGNASRNSEGKQ